MKIGLYTSVVYTLPLDELIPTLTSLGIEAAELPAGGFIDSPHCPVADLLASEDRRQEWRAAFETAGIALNVLNVNGNPLHPVPEVREKHANDIRLAIRLAEKAGIDRLVVMPGAPGTDRASTRSSWPVAPWESGLLDVLEYQQSVAVPFWTEIAALAGDHGIRLCLEMHPHTVAFNPSSLERLLVKTGAENLGVNMDPSHMFWQGIDPLRTIRRFGDRVWQAAAKDTELFPEAIAENGVLEDGYRRAAADEHPVDIGGGFTINHPPAKPSWRFSAVGRGHDGEWWGEFVRTLQGVGFDDCLSIENEDSLLPPLEAIRYSVETLRHATAGKGT